jgi:hypothetical protein
MLPAGSQVTSVGWRKRNGVLVGGFRLAPEHHDDAALGIELDHHVGALVDGPDVVVLVDLHDMPVRPGIQIPADLADIAAVGREFQDLRGGGGEGRPGHVAARIDEDMALGIHRHAGDLAEMQVVGKLEKVRHRVERDLRHRLLRERGCADERDERQQ